MIRLIVCLKLFECYSKRLFVDKRIIAVLLSLLFLGSFKPVVAMHGKVLRGVQVVTSGAVIVTGAKRAYDMNEELKKEVVGTPASLPIQQFVRDRFCELNVPKEK